MSVGAPASHVAPWQLARPTKLIDAVRLHNAALREISLRARSALEATRAARWIPPDVAGSVAARVASPLGLLDRTIDREYSAVNIVV